MADGPYLIDEERGSRADQRWVWSLFSILANPPGMRTDGHAPTVNAAKAEFEANWRRWRNLPKCAALGNLLGDPNWLLGSGFCRSRCWLGYYNRIGNRFRNIDGFRAGLMSPNHARPP